MSLPVVDNDLARRLVRAEGAHMVSLLSALQRHYGEAAGIHIRRFGEAVALLCPGMANPLLNRVLGFGPVDLNHLDEIWDWYRDHQVVCRLEVVPVFASETFLAGLSERGLSPCAFSTTLYGLPSASPSDSVAYATTRLVAGDGLEEWAAIFSEVYDLGADTDAVRESVRVQYGQPEWRCYIADMDGKAAAIGALHVQDGVGMLISGATMPEFRRRGCQTALLHRRLADAALLGCDLVASYTEVGSTSQHNMERAGLRIAYTKTEWSA